MPSSDTPNINIIALDADDDLWVVQTDLPGLQSILTNPAQFVHNHVVINGQPGVLVQPFVVVFQKFAAKPDGPEVLVQGINQTSLLTVKYADNLQMESGEDSILPPDEVHEIMNHGEAYYSHLQLAGRTPAQVANSIVRTLIAPNDHFSELNALSQTVNGQEAVGSDKISFQLHPTDPHQLIYQGFTAMDSEGDEDRIQDDPPPITCIVNSGGWDGDGNVNVSQTQIKIYTCLTPVGG